MFDFPHYLLLKPSAFVFLFVSRPHRFRAFALLQSKLWAVCLAQLEESLTASSWGVGCEPSYCSWEDGSRFSIWVISSAKRAPSMFFLAADVAREKIGARQTLMKGDESRILTGLEENALHEWRMEFKVQEVAVKFDTKRNCVEAESQLCSNEWNISY